MKTGIRYIVTKGSDDGTFQAGDHIWLLGDGSVACIEAQGWIRDRSCMGTAQAGRRGKDQGSMCVIYCPHKGNSGI